MKQLFAWLVLFVLVDLTIVDCQDSNRPTYQPTQPTVAPTYRPTPSPTSTPTEYPTVNIGSSGDYIEVVSTVNVAGLEISDVQSEQEFFELLYSDAINLESIDSTESDISISITKIQDRTLKECFANGTAITHRVLSKDTTAYTLIRASIDSGSFVSTYTQGLQSVYDSTNVFLCLYASTTADNSGNNIVSNGTNSDYFGLIDSISILTEQEVYPPAIDPTFVELLWSENLIYGFVLSALGVIWLWFLRSDVDDGGIYNDEEEENNGMQQDTHVGNVGNVADNQKIPTTVKGERSNKGAIEMTNQ